MGRLFAVVGLAVLLADQGDYDLVGGRVPLWLKVFHTLFLGVLVPVYWRCSASVLPAVLTTRRSTPFVAEAAAGRSNNALMTAAAEPPSRKPGMPI